MSLCDLIKRLVECTVEESKNAGCWTNRRGQRAKTNCCAWQMGCMNCGKKERIFGKSCE